MGLDAEVLFDSEAVRKFVINYSCLDNNQFYLAFVSLDPNPALDGFEAAMLFDNM